MDVNGYFHRPTRTQTVQNIERVSSQFSPIFLAEMQDVALLNRIDTKYLIPLSQLSMILGDIRHDYKILEVDGIRMNRYHTVYYDDPGFVFYKQHHNRHATRYKIRTRQYVDTNLSFLEVKHRTNQKRTIKSRLPFNPEDERPAHDFEGFIDEHVPVNVQDLEPKLWNDYSRITLVGKSRPERVTIDTKLSFGWGNAFSQLPGVAIAEVKQEHFNQSSDFIQQMRRFGIRPTSFSKYCIGVGLIYEGVKTNNFKPQLRKVHNIMQAEGNYGLT